MPVGWCPHFGVRHTRGYGQCCQKLAEALGPRRNRDDLLMEVRQDQERRVRAMPKFLMAIKL